MLTLSPHEFEGALSNLREELSHIRTGRATPTLVEKLSIDYYGTPTPLVQIASISAPDAKTVLIQPWDSNATKEIEKALISSSLGIQPVNEGKVVRLSIPPLTEERRKELQKIVREKLEDARVRVRTLRENILKDLQKQKVASEVREDDFFRQQKDLQKLVDDVNSQIKEIGELKEKEITTL